jgi:hypothetical protein
MKEPAAVEPSPAERSLRHVVALSALGASIVHFVSAPVHFTDDSLHGLFFLAVAWVQLAIALVVGLGSLPRRLPLMGVAAFNLAVAGVWVVSRTAGVPGERAEPIGFPDALATGFEVVIVVGALVLALAASRVAQLSFRPQGATAALGVSTLAVLALVTASITPALGGGHETGDGGHHGGAEAAAGHAQGTHGADAAATGDRRGAAGHQSDDTTDADTAGHDANGGGSAEGGHGKEWTVEELKARGLTQRQLDGVEETIVHGPPPPDEPIDQATRDALAADLVSLRDYALKHPTVADAQAAGFTMVTPFVPLIGAHYMNFSHFDGTFEAAKPEMLLYDGTRPDSRLQGVAYFVLSGKDTPPEGFAGPNDHWHQHVGLCLKGGQVVGGEKISDEECKERGGSKASLDGAWLVHAWVVPGWESPWGVFSAENPNIGK